MTRLRNHAPTRAQRIAARLAWARKTVNAWHDAQRAMDARCTEAVMRLSEEDFERLCDEEEAKVAAIRAQIEDVIERDVWPRELYWGGL